MAPGAPWSLRVRVTCGTDRVSIFRNNLRFLSIEDFAGRLVSVSDGLPALHALDYRRAQYLSHLLLPSQQRPR
jgi:hypothetical protein